MSFEISDAQPKDANQLYTVQRESWLETYPNAEAEITRQDIVDNFINKDVRLKKWKMWLESVGQDSHIWKIINSERIIGFCTAAKGKEVNYLRAIYLLPGYQNQGYGSKLINKAFEWLGDEKNIIVELASYNEKAINFYKKFGFKYSKVVTDLTNGILPSGKAIPQIQMIRTKKV